jgi:hypothetical protein
MRRKIRALEKQVLMLFVSNKNFLKARTERIVDTRRDKVSHDGKKLMYCSNIRYFFL